MKCPKCGKEAGDSKRCGSCGASMAGTTRVAKPTSPAAVVVDQPAPATESAPSAATPGNQLVIPLPSFGAHGRTLALIGGGVALVILLVVLLMAGGSATFDGTSAFTMKTSREKVLRDRTDEEKKAFNGLETELLTIYGFAGSRSQSLGDIRADLHRGDEMTRLFAHGKTFEQFMEEAPKAIDEYKQSTKR